MKAWRTRTSPFSRWAPLSTVALVTGHPPRLDYKTQVGSAFPRCHFWSDIYVRLSPVSIVSIVSDINVGASGRMYRAAAVNRVVPALPYALPRYVICSGYAPKPCPSSYLPKG